MLTSNRDVLSWADASSRTVRKGGSLGPEMGASRNGGQAKHSLVTEIIQHFVIRQAAFGLLG